MAPRMLSFLRAAVVGFALLMLLDPALPRSPAFCASTPALLKHTRVELPPLSVLLRGPSATSRVAVHRGATMIGFGPSVLGDNMRGIFSVSPRTTARLQQLRPRESPCRKTTVFSHLSGVGAELPNLRHLSGKTRLVDVLYQFVANDTKWVLSAEDAAVSLHFLHRADRRRDDKRTASASFVVRRRSSQLHGSSERMSAEPDRVSSTRGSSRQDTLMVVLGTAIAQRIRSSSLEPKYLSMALTAIADRVHQHAVFKDVFQLTSKSIQDMAHKSVFGQFRSRTLNISGGGQDSAQLHKFSAQTVSMLATAFVKSDMVEADLFTALSLLLKQLPPERLSARSVGMVLKSFARANALVNDMELLRFMCSVLVKKPLEEFDVQSCTDIVFSLARTGQQGRARAWAGDERDLALEHMIAAILALPPEELAGGASGGSQQAVSTLAALCSGLVSVRVTDARVFDKLSAVGQAIAPRHWHLQAIATMMHAFASAGHSDKQLVNVLTTQLLRIPLRSVEARSAANIAWCAAVQESQDPALLCWIWRSLDLLLPTMQADGLSQVHQFLLHAQIGNFTREDVYAAFYGTRAAPPAVRQSLNSKEESAEERCRREFILESQAQRLAQQSSRLHEHVSTMIADVAPRLLGFPSAANVDASGAHLAWLEHEHIDDVSGYSVDILIPAQSIAIEVDGPTHFDWRGERPMGATVMKHRHLRRLGFRLVSVSYREWEEAGVGAEDAAAGRRALVTRKLAQVLELASPKGIG